MPNNIPSWEEWNEQLTKEQREYSHYKIMVNMDGRLSNVERKLEGGRLKTSFLTLIGSFVGGFSAVGAVVLAAKAKIGFGGN